MKNLKVAYLLHCLVPGGASISFTFLYHSLNQYALEKCIFISHQAPVSEALCKARNIDCASIEHLPLECIYNDQINSTSLLRFLFTYRKRRKDSVKMLEKVQCDILHINSSVFPHLLPILHKRTNIKLVVHVREMICRHGIGLLQRYFLRMISRYADAIIAISDNEASFFPRQDKISVIPNPFDFDLVDQVEERFFRRNYLWSDSTIVISMFGYFAKAKGHLEALKVFEELRKMELRSDYKFVIVGSRRPEVITPDKYKRFLKKILNTLRLRSYPEFDFFDYIRKKNLQEEIVIIDYCPEVYKLVKDSDIIIRPALSADPWGRDILEALAFRKPVVATGTSEFYIENGKNGFLVSPKQPEKMAEKLAYLINHPRLIKQMGEAGFQKAYSMCDFRQYGEKITAVYNNLMNN